MQDEIRTGPALDPPSRTASRFPPPRLLVAGLAMATLAGCANAHVGNVATAPAAGPAPVEILVAVDSAIPPQSSDAPVAGEVGIKLQADVIQRLIKNHVTAEAFVPGTSHPSAAVLHVSITEADAGNSIERFVIGFGAGRATLQVKADLASSDQADARSVTSFSTSGDTGRKPGMILPGGIALATRDLVHLAIGGGLKVATSVGDNIDAPTGKTADAIVGQLQKYYATAGWYWPANA
jgi:hypothetical protein